VIRAILLDVGGVFHLPTERKVRHALAAAGFALGPGGLARAHYAGMAGHDEQDAEYEELLPPYCRALAIDLGVPADQMEDAVTRLVASFMEPESWTDLIEDAVATLPELRASGKKLGIVSNADGSVEARLRDAGVCQVGPGRGVEMDVIIDSGAAGVRKPDPRIFRMTLEAIGVDASDAVHVGDSLITDVGGARAAGIRPLHLDPFRLCPYREDHEHLETLRGVLAAL